VNIDKMKTQHDEIIHKINQLREYSRDGVSTHAQEIAQTVVSMSSVIKVHLSTEASKLMGQDEAFRRDANSVLRKVHERMQRENHQFYPRVEQL